MSNEIRTITSADCLDDYIHTNLDGYTENPGDKIPADGIVDEYLHEEIVEAYEAWFDVSLEGEARLAFDSIMEERYDWYKTDFHENNQD